MNAPSVDIASILEEESSLCLVFADNLFVGREPSKPFNCVTIFDTPGMPDALASDDTGLRYEKPSVQIRIRNQSYPTAMALADEIKDVLHCRAGFVCDDVLYTGIYHISGPTLLDWDDAGNARIVMNFNLQRRKQL